MKALKMNERQEGEKVWKAYKDNFFPRLLSEKKNVDKKNNAKEIFIGETTFKCWKLFW